MSLRIKVKLRTIVKIREPRIGDQLRCHTLLHMSHSQSDIRGIPGKLYTIVAIAGYSHFRIIDEAGVSHGFDLNTYSKWFEFVE